MTLGSEPLHVCTHNGSASIGANLSEGQGVGVLEMPVCAMGEEGEGVW